MLLVYGSDAKYVNFMWLDPESGWSYTTQSPFRNNYMKAVSLSRWEHYLMGGHTAGYHGDRNSRCLNRISFKICSFGFCSETGIYGILTQRGSRTGI